MAKKQEQQSMGKRVGVSVLLLAGLVIVAAIVAALFKGDASSSANTAIIRVVGPIAGESEGGLFDDSVASSSEIVSQLERAREDGMTAVILEINSPGGSAVASDEIGQKVKELRENGIIVVAWVREVGASGAYWIASSADWVVANRMSITGSIGVIGSYLEFAEFIDDWNVTYNRLVAGERKDIGDPFQSLDRADRQFIQGKLDRIHAFFIEEVAGNRNMSVESLAQYADGSFYLGVEAQEIGLVDQLGGKQEAIAYIKERTGDDVETRTYSEEKTFLELLLGVSGPKLETFLPILV